MGLLEMPNLYALREIPVDESFTDVIKLMHGAAILSPLFVGSLVLISSSRIANWVSRSNGNETHISDAGLREIQSLAFATSGLIILSVSLPKLIRSWIWTYQNNETNDQTISYFASSHSLSEFVVTVLGLSLFVGSGFYVRLYLWFREFGLGNK